MVGAFLSNIGGWMQSAAVSWIAFTELTDYDAVAVGITLALQFGPRLFLVPLSGWIADRFNPRVTLYITQAIMMSTGLVMGAVLLTGTAELWHLYLISGILGTAGAIEAPTKNSFTPKLVPKEDLGNVISLDGTSYQGARIIGPALAGVLLAVVNPGWLFVANGASFILVICALAMMRTSEIRETPKPVKGSGGTADAVRYIRATPGMAVVIVMSVIIGATALNFSVYVPAMVVHFGAESAVFGTISSMMAAGSVAGGLIAARVKTQTLGRLTFAAALLAVAAAVSAFTPGVWWFAAACVALGFGSLTATAAISGFLQTQTPDGMRGRVMAVLFAALAIGSLTGGPMLGAVINMFGAQTSMLVVAAGCAVAAVLGWRSAPSVTAARSATADA